MTNMDIIFETIEKNHSIAPEKIAFLKEMYQGTKGLQQEKDKDKTMAFMMNVAMKSRERNIVFTKEEMQMIINILKQNANPTESAMMDTILKKHKQ